MLAILIAVRDFLIIAALAWVGVTFENSGASDTALNCTGEACEGSAR